LENYIIILLSLEDKRRFAHNNQFLIHYFTFDLCC